MKNFIINIVACFLIIVMSSNFSMAQMEAFNYQGIAVDMNGAALSNETIGLQFSIIEADPNGTPAYVESQTSNTTAIGHFAADVGSGTQISGDFQNINWSSGSIYLKVEMDADGGTNYSFSNTVEMLSVPYALVVATSNNTPAPGPVGPTGLAGDPGPTGPTGADGLPGINGGSIPGPQGNDGAQGPTGPIGPLGPAGEPGAPNGPQGPKGDPGPKGSEQGDQGPEGAQGPRGAQGPAGIAGPPGAAGANGPTSNEVGPQGPVGPPGPAGGPQGEPGPNGPDGLPGPQGPSGAVGPSGFSFQTSAVIRSTVPTPGPDLNLYIDDGTNTEDGKPSIRFYNGTEWIDL